MSAAHATRLKSVHRAGPRAADGTPASARFSSQSSAGAGYSILKLPVSDPVLAIAKLVGAHDSVEDPAELFTRLVVDRAKAIGIARLADIEASPEAANLRGGATFRAFPQGRDVELQGGEEASRLAHNQETVGSSPTSATSCNSEGACVSAGDDCPPAVAPLPVPP